MTTVFNFEARAIVQSFVHSLENWMEVMREKILTNTNQDSEFEFNLKRYGLS